MDKVLVTKITLGVIIGAVCILVLLTIYHYADFGIKRSEEVSSRSMEITYEFTKFIQN